MIKRRREQEIEVRENMRGGEGKVEIRHYLKKDQIKAPCRLCAELILKPGCGIGLHEHVNEDEVFIIQRGKALVTDEGRETTLEAGDVILTGGAASHSIKNIGSEDLIVTAIIMQYKD